MPADADGSAAAAVPAAIRADRVRRDCAVRVAERDGDAAHHGARHRHQCHVHGRRARRVPAGKQPRPPETHHAAVAADGGADWLPVLVRAVSLRAADFDAALWRTGADGGADGALRAVDAVCYPAGAVRAGDGLGRSAARDAGYHCFLRADAGSDEYLLSDAERADFRRGAGDAGRQPCARDLERRRAAISEAGGVIPWDSGSSSARRRFCPSPAE